MRRGFHLITAQVTRSVPELRQVRIGLLNVFIQHTSASLTINENADPDVRIDFETALNHLVPETLDYVHTIEGTDDMPAHIKSSLMGCSLIIPICTCLHGHVLPEQRHLSRLCQKLQPPLHAALHAPLHELRVELL